MDDPKKQLADKLKSANNILVTVSRDPSVDQLAALLGLSLLLNKAGKHAAAVFSGEVPSTLEFLKPEQTIEKNTDSLRDFIIALDKSKADKLRYKVEDNVVKIFITPYKTSITQEDFEFSQGDFNVDVVVALGVQRQEDLDDAITAHGRILHDATVASLNTSPDGGLGSINWHDPQASSLSELVSELGQELAEQPFDEQIATALLTGVVAETDRFRNEKTSSRTMTVSALLLSAGANQQLVASQLDQPPAEPEIPESKDDSSGDTPAQEDQKDDEPKTGKDGVLDIDHANDEPAESPAAEDTPPLDLPEPSPDQVTQEPETPVPDADVINDGHVSQGASIVTQPPTLGGTLTANSTTPKLDPVTDPFSLPAKDEEKILERKPNPPFSSPAKPNDEAAQPLTPPPANWSPPTPPAPAPPPPVSIPPAPAIQSPPPAPSAPLPEPASAPVTKGDDAGNETLTDIEKNVQSSHADQTPPEPPKPEDTGLNAARDEVSQALKQGLDPNRPPSQPLESLNAQPMGEELHPVNPLPDLPPSLEEQIPGLSTKLGQPPKEPSDDDKSQPDKPQDPNSPPPVPPPIPFQFGKPPAQQ